MRVQLGELRAIVGAKEAGDTGGKKIDPAKHARGIPTTEVQLEELRVIVGEKEAGDKW